MLSKRVIMNEWRDLVRRLDDMTLRYTHVQAADVVPPNSPEQDNDALHPPGSPARAPASLSA